MNQMRKSAGRAAFLFFAVVLFSGLRTFGSDPAMFISLSVRAESKKNREQNKTVEQKPNALVTTMIDELTELCTLEIELENRRHGGEVQLEWYLISKKTAPNGSDDLVVFDGGRELISLAEQESVVREVVSKPFVFTVRNIDTLGIGGSSSSEHGAARQIRAGDVYEGYIVLVKSGGEILKRDSNSSRFEKDEWLERCAACSPPRPVKKKK